MVARRWSAADQTVYEAIAAGLRLAHANDGWVGNTGVPSEKSPTPAMTVTLTAGTYRIAGTGYTSAGQDVTINAAHATLPRQDLISMSSSGTATYTAGTAAAAPGSGVNYPDPPDLPAGEIPIALVEVAAGVTSIIDARIVDIRSELPDHDDLANVSANDHHNQAHALSGADHTGTLSHSALADLTTGDPHTQYPTQAEFDDHSARHESGGADVLASATVSAAGFESAADKRLLAYFSAGNSGAALTIDWNSGATQHVTLTANCTFTFSNPAQPGWYALRLAQDATGSRTATWPATVKWSGGTAPTLTTTASRVDLITFYWDGAAYLGASILNYTV